MIKTTFRIGTLFGASLLSLFSTAVRADNSFQSAAPTVSFIGSGCPQGDSGTNVRWDGSRLHLNFSGMVTQRGDGVPLTESRKTCSITISMNLPAGYTYSLGSFEARGNEALQAEETRTVTVTNFFEGQGATSTQSVSANGPSAKNFVAGHTYTGAESLWSPCDAQRAETVTVALRIGADIRSCLANGSVATLDSIQLPVRIKACGS
ncbi:MAG: DUF4360 domain-containing protein [Chitinophagaceae bacterium]|nr:DUF4360 domain-containing protein [Oligoflexus sp.]